MPTAQTGRCGRCLASLLFWDTQPWVLSSAACSPPPFVLDLSFYFPDSGHFCFLCLDFSLNCGNDQDAHIKYENQMLMEGVHGSGELSSPCFRPEAAGTWELLLGAPGLWC